MKNYSPSKAASILKCYIAFTDREGNGFNFACDKHGNLFKMSSEAKENYEFCISHPELFYTYNEFRTEKLYYTIPASGTCVCGEDVVLTGNYYGATQCPKCGRWYNNFGQRLKDPEYWVEDFENEY